MLQTFQPLLDAAHGLDLADPAAAERVLNAKLDPASEAGKQLAEALGALYAAGSIAHKGEAPVTWSRVSKSSPETHGFSIDVVHMSAPGPRHRHPAGEVDYCIALEGAPTFDGRAPGWVVLPPDSTHVPTVEGGSMLIVYLLPGGEIEFLS